MSLCNLTRLTIFLASNTQFIVRFSSLFKNVFLQLFVTSKWDAGKVRVLVAVSLKSLLLYSSLPLCYPCRWFITETESVLLQDVPRSRYWFVFLWCHLTLVSVFFVFPVNGSYFQRFAQIQIQLFGQEYLQVILCA